MAILWVTVPPQRCGLGKGLADVMLSGCRRSLAASRIAPLMRAAIRRLLTLTLPVSFSVNPLSLSPANLWRVV